MSVACHPRRYGAVNWRGLMTLALKDVHRTLKSYRYTILGPVISNLLFLAVFQLALGDGTTRVGTLDFLQFLAPGLIVFTVCERAFGSASESLLFDKQEGMLADTLMAPLTPAELTLGYAAGAAGSGLIAGAAVAATTLPFVALPIASLSLLLFFAIGGALMHSLVGVLVGLWAERWDHQTAAATFLVIPFAFLSGTFYSIQALPDLGRTLVSLNPVFYVIDGFRAGATGQADGSLATGVAVVTLVVLALAAWAHRLFRRGYKIKP
jgi:ABC-2 type transport system permease protein